MKRKFGVNSFIILIIFVIMIYICVEENSEKNIKKKAIVDRKENYMNQQKLEIDNIENILEEKEYPKVEVIDEFERIYSVCKIRNS